MQHIYRLLMIGLIAFAVASCDKDDNSAEQALLAGEWEPIEIYTNNGVNIASSPFGTFTSTYTFEGKDFDVLVVFNENPNTYSSSGTMVYVSIINFMGIEQTIESTVNGFNGSGTWSLNGSILTQVPTGQDPMDMEVLELSGERLRVKMEIDVTFVDQGVTNRDLATVYATFQRK